MTNHFERIVITSRSFSIVNQDCLFCDWSFKITVVMEVKETFEMITVADRGDKSFLCHRCRK